MKKDKKQPKKGKKTTINGKLIKMDFRKEILKK
jgi:hypothetical protein